jgi:hypothetical protein
MRRKQMMETEEKLFDDGEGAPPKPKFSTVKSFRMARAELLDPDQIWTTKYQPDYPEKLIEMASKGLSVRAFAATIGVGHVAVYRWAKNIPEFAEAMCIAEMKRHLFYEVTALRNINNRDFNNQLFIRLAQTIGKWRDEDEMPTDQPDVEDVSNIDPSQMTAEQRRNRIRQLTEQVKLG